MWFASVIGGGDCRILSVADLSTASLELPALESKQRVPAWRPRRRPCRWLAPQPEPGRPIPLRELATAGRLRFQRRSKRGSWTRETTMMVVAVRHALVHRLSPDQHKSKIRAE